MWPAVWPGVSSTRTSCVPNLKVSPWPTWVSMPGILAASARGPTMVHLVSALTARLPSVWSPWWWVVRMCVSRQPFSGERGGDRLGIGRIDRGHDAGLGVADQHAEIVGEARELVNFELGHEDNPGAFALLFRFRDAP